MIKINISKKVKEIMVNLHQNANRLFAALILMIVTGCVHNKDSCFEAFGGSILWNRYLTVKFDNKFKQLKQVGSTKCTRNENFLSFSVGTYVSDERIKLEDGNSAVIHLSLTSFTNKLKSDQIGDVVSSFSRRSFLEVNSLVDQNNTRFSRVYSKIGPLTEDKDKVCRIVTTSVKDYKAKNIPPSEQYLLQNDIHKTCFFKTYNQVVAVSASYRIKPNLERVFWPHDAIENLNLMLLNALMNDGKPLGNLIKVEEGEINNLK
jgi:hypothetical protein